MALNKNVSWEQSLVNAEVSVNRAMFEMNKPGRKIYPSETSEIRQDYLIREIKSAVDDLNDCLQILQELKA